MKTGIEKIGDLEINWDASIEELERKEDEFRCKLTEMRVKHHKDTKPLSDAYYMLITVKDYKIKQQKLNKCFYLGSGKYYKVQGFDEEERERGILIDICKDKSYALYLNSGLWAHDLDDAKEISESHFLEILNKLTKNIQNIGDEYVT